MALTRRRGARSLAASPGFIPPQLAALVKHAPDGPAWPHEIKLDGYRMHGRLDSRDAHRALVLAEHTVNSAETGTRITSIPLAQYG